MKEFKGKVVFIAGGGSGAGLGQAELFGSLGSRVVIADIRKDHLADAVRKLSAKGIDVLPIQLDLTDRKAYAVAADLVEIKFGTPPELVILTAGVNTFGPAEATTFEDFDWVMGVCLGGVINGLVTFVPRMIKAGIRGHIAAVSSMGAFMGGPGCAPYSAAKAAVNNLMESYYQSLKDYGIGVTVQCPGNINSNIWDAVATRPAHLQNTGYNVSDKTKAVLKSIHSEGINPVELAMQLKIAIENEQFLTIPMDNPEQMLRSLYETYINYSTPEGMKRIAEAQKAQQEMARKMAEENADKAPVGFESYEGTGYGKARGDIDWLPEGKKFRG